MANKSWNDWKFQIHGNKLEWVNTIICIGGNNLFCVSSKRFNLKDNNKTAHWVGHSKLKTLDLEDLFKRKRKINEIEAS